MRRSRAIIAFLLCLSLVASTPLVASAATASDLEAAQRRAADARKAAAAAADLAEKLKAETKALDMQVDALQAEVASLTPKIEEATGRTRRLTAEVDSLLAQIEHKKAEIAATQAEYERQQLLLADRIQSSYKQGAWHYLEIVLGSHDIRDLIARTTLVQRVIESNQSVAIDLANTKAELDRAKTELDRTHESVAAKQAEAAAVEKQLRDLRGQRQQAANQQQNVLEQKSALMKASEADAARYRALAEEEEAESRRIQAELRRRSSSGSGVYNGVMAWPVPGFFHVGSGFGWRTHPIFGDRRFHAGIDIGSGGGPSINGATIVAAGDGSVIFTGWRGGYGNTIMLDHGNGVVTLYAHIQSGGILVSNGAGVSKGDPIGRVGSTGNSTGPHLHFEVRVNGEAKNPMGYLR